MNMSLTSATPATTVAPLAPVVPRRGALHPLGSREVRITGGFWGDRQRRNHDATLPHIAARLESEGWLPNFDLAAAGSLPQGRRGREFADSEIYKYLEALAWEIGRTGDAALEERFAATAARVAAAQETDGYLNTNFGRPGQGARWSDLEWGHELYCLGHLFQAAVARYRTTGDADDVLVRVATRGADLVCATFGPDGNDGICGHPEIEVGLAELGRALQRPEYIDQAGLFVDRRGHGRLADIEFGRSYFQDDAPIRDAEVLRGHAVRANYLASGAVDVAIEHDDQELLDAIRSQWDRAIARRTYITGGQGSHHQDEAFGQDWELPPDRAYSETCAGVGSIMLAWRLLLAEGDPRYADLIERTLFNVVATSPSDDGRSFYYTNTLHQRTPGIPADPDRTSLRAASSLRAPWFEVSCCPPNVARTLASLDGYVASVTADAIHLHQYAPSLIDTVLGNGAQVSLQVSTSYPSDGAIRIEVRRDATFALVLRVPAWAAGAGLVVTPVDGEAQPGVVNPGEVRIDREFHAGDVIELTLPVSPRVSRADSRIDAVRGCVAVERGPEVLALESVDLGDESGDVADAMLDLSAPLIERDGQVWARIISTTSRDIAWPYETHNDELVAAPKEVPLIAYHSWANRGPSTMRIWIPTA